MNAKLRFLNVLARKKTDRLPVTPHHLMPSYLEKYMGGISDQDFFDYFGLDPIKWIIACTNDASKGEFFDSKQGDIGFLEARRICTDNWRFSSEDITGHAYPTKRLNIITPVKTLSMVLQSDAHTTWLREHIIKEKSDIDIIAKYMPAPKCDIDAINKVADDFGERGLVRGAVFHVLRLT